MKTLAAKLPALPMACGALIAALAFYGHSPLEYAIIALCLAVSFATIYYGVRRATAYFFLGFLGCGFSCLLNRVPDIPPHLIDGNNQSFRVELLRVNEGHNTLHCLAKVRKAHGQNCPPFNAYLTIIDHGKLLNAGDIIDIYARTDDIGHMSEIPFLDTESLNALCDGVSAKMLVDSDHISIVGRSNTLKYRLLGIRDDLALLVYSTPINPDASSLIASVCLGTGDTPLYVKERFRAAGIAHLLCISGFHVGLVAGLAIIVLLPLRMWSHAGRIRYLLIILFVWFYVAIIGFTPAAIRAAVMLTAYYIGRLLQRGSSGFNSLALAFAVLLMVQPRWIYSVGMQLSVCAVTGILLFAQRLNPAPMRYRMLHRLCELFTVPAAASLGTAPVILFWFHKIPLLTIITNVFATLIFIPLMILGSITVACYHLGLPIGALAGTVDFIYNMAVRVCDYSTAGTILTNIYLPGYKLLLMIAGILLLATALHTAHRKVRIASLAAMIAVAGLSACRDNKETGNEFIVAGNNKSSELVIRHNGKGYTMSLSGVLNNFSYMTDYFGGHDIPSDSIVRNPAANSLDFEGIAIATNKKKCLLLKKADYLIVDGTFKGDAHETLVEVQPKHAVLCANLSLEKRAEWEKACSESAVAVTPLGAKALRIQF